MDPELDAEQLDIVDIFNKTLMEFMSSRRTFWKEARDFLDAINWTEPLVVSLIVFHSVVLLLVLLSHRRFTLQAVIFFTIAVLCGSSQWLNSFLSEHWETVATQNYFDANGAFISIVFSLPLVLIGFLLVVMMVYSAGVLLVEVKKQELRRGGRVPRLRVVNPPSNASTRPTPSQTISESGGPEDKGGGPADTKKHQ
ncbi:unnamed protein product [Vitrella brassicaformis CCMP3155]|uniref:Uncharacterized protein n=2 Tax=Vitrella brassicaformis TaxID=1169539 RepID=A0A0G4GBD4_VITBC|nr:unnamed protein product [Vitrella brassicaformis CCMP3155]|eukprot:CEM26459.1 unnamed protein product [Vitrella brassicaformis CCMP3155]